MIPLLLALCLSSGNSTFPVSSICEGPGCPLTGPPHPSFRGFLVETLDEPLCEAVLVNAAGCTWSDSSCVALGGVVLANDGIGWLYNICEVPGVNGACDVELTPGSALFITWN